MALRVETKGLTPKKSPVVSISENKVQHKRKVKSKPIDGKEVVCLISHDMIRELLVPSEESDQHPAVMKKSELENLKTHLQRKQHLEDKEELQTKLMKDSEIRKKKLHKWDEKRKQKLKPELVDGTESRRASHLAQRALEMRLELEDDVKKANQLILSTKCHAIRDAQVLEKTLMRKELEENELKLDHMMEQERLRGLKEEERQKEKKDCQKYEYVQQIMKQMKDNESERLKEAKYIEEESEMMNKLRVQMQIEEQEAVRKKEKEQEKMKKGLDEVNRQLLELQEKKRLEIQALELRVQEYLCRKAAQHRSRQQEQEKLRLAKEQELARLRSLQERQQDLQEKMEEIYAQRVQDEDLEAHRKAILQQMREKEIQRVRDREKMYQEALEQHKERTLHDENVKNVMCKKIHNLRHQKVPERYIKEIERALKIKP
ncbi:cilia- and flagella-associated protein 45-like isoform X3 [Schistocerca nitens]|uniref:cilia- and flagella-associated protein 45-like isoform X3 n=1 Tax=Schistocerca nitens TaxID=7011 RepID=UPI00211844A6|nr:cilia- and flagella-associated protein 45-like isoform X3 [Schistocerca nitens]